MANHILSKKTGKLILKKRVLRILTLLNVVFLIVSIVFLSLFLSYYKKVKENETKIVQTQQTLADLQYLVEIDFNGQIDSDILDEKSFAQYDEVIPFITLLESLFSVIDPQADITIKSQEKQIFIDHYADYRIVLDMNEKKDLFLKALDELYNSSFITKITSFTMNYRQDDDGLTHKLNEVDFVIRLYLS
ncbi:hypothetical protein KJ742_06600 [Patescibacteria group bacterium]|nr:hypothetical protein [Patescibacteria group bacterium]MBU1683582.1 hypothetical protein [Patescibacteria group bacterium]MBU1935482.1 hypothetical protein [Patescibacteria group bacterium]